VTQRPSQPQFELVAAYLDGTLDAAQRQAFEASLASDPALAAELSFQRRLDSSLTRLFEDGPLAAAVAAPAEPAVAGKIGPAPRWRFAWVAAAAVLLLGATFAVFFLSRPTDPNLMSPEKLYATMQVRQWVPEWKCKDDQEFIQTVQNKLGDSILVPADTPGLEVIGWAYGSAYKGYPITPNSMILITKKDNDHILLVVDRARDDRSMSVSKKSGLHLFRDVEGDLVLYEITPRPEPAVLDVARAHKPKNVCPTNP
jgi:hypothetical protein